MTAAISVVICAYSSERVQLLLAALASVARQTMPPLEVLLVIDNNDALQALATTFAQDIRVLRNDRTRGLSGARNAGVAHAQGNVVAFLDDDAVAEPDWLERLAAHYADQSVIGVGGLVVPTWPKARPEWLPAEFRWVIGCSYKGLPEGVAPVRNLIGCNMSFRKEVFDVAMFSEHLGREGADAAGCEETELCIQLGAVFPECRILYEPGAVVRHSIANERLTWRYFRARCLAEGRSKAQVVASTGARSGLASERNYSLRVLPAGVARGIGDVLSERRAAGALRAAAIVAGLALVSWSFLWSRWMRTGQSTARAFMPIRVIDVDLERQLPRIEAIDPVTGKRYGGAYCLIRRSGSPVKVIEFPLRGDGMSAPALRMLLSRAVATAPALPGPLALAANHDSPVRVVVATRDRPTALEVCLDSLLRQDYRHFEVVVVDNAPSSSSTAELIESRYVQTGLVRYIREDQPGLGYAHNRGLADATAPIIAFTDDDVIVDPKWLSAIERHFSEPDVGCVTGLILPAELETRAQYWTERHGGFGKGFIRRSFDLGKNRPNDRLFPFAAGTLGSGANMAFRTSALASIGGFDLALGAGTLARGGDDLAAFASIIRAGNRLIYEPEAIVWHHHRREETGMRRQAYNYGVGLGAYLTKTMIDDPSTLLDFAKASPWALAHILSPSSSKNSRLPIDFPAGMQWSERLGMLVGAPAYLRSRAAMKRHLRPKATERTAPVAARHRETWEG
jgi:glycosyltransferase involved in cell wall biosynthesis